MSPARWPSIPERHAMLGEAADIFRTLWAGGVRNWKGDYFVIDHAQLYDLPSQPIPLVFGVSGKASVKLAAEKGDGIMAIEPRAELVNGFRNQRGGGGSSYGEALLAYAASEQEGLRIAHERFRFAALGWAGLSELRAVDGFEAASRFIRPNDIPASLAAGPDVEKHLAIIRRYVDAGFDHIVLTCPGDDQQGFLDFFEKELRPRL